MASIEIRGAREHNLKGFDVDIPLGKITCVTGVSGCGKSSLVHDTVYAESQRMFLEGLSGNAMGQRLMKAPAVDSIKNLRPSLDVSQNYYNFNPRSTVGTVTEISHHLRTLFALISNRESGVHVDESLFSANNPSSWCKRCQGTGETFVISLDKVIPDTSRTLAEGAILCYKGSKTSMEHKTLLGVCEALGINPDIRYCDLNDDQAHQLLYRKEPVTSTIRYKSVKGRYRQKALSERGVIVELEDKLKDIDTPSTLASIRKYLEKQICPDCEGAGLRAEVTAIRVCGLSIADVERLSIVELISWLKDVREGQDNEDIGDAVSQLCSQIENKAGKLIELKVGYLSLSRKVPTLSGGESQRVRIANQLACSLDGLVYILDEPCRGLHLKDVQSIIEATRTLVQRDNTVIAIEHNTRFISSADWEIRLGPSGGSEGGRLVRTGVPHRHFDDELPLKTPKKTSVHLSINHVTSNNIIDQDITLPLGVVTAITGVSGSGKSSILRALCERIQTESSEGGISKTKISHVDLVDQQPIGKTPRSTVGSYLGVLDEIRNLFSKLEDSAKLGLSPSSFSMNVSGGRCETCQGTGLEKISYRYLPDTYVKCSKCHGRRFSKEVISVRLMGMTITDILDAPINELAETFSSSEGIHHVLDCVVRIGLGYLSLGQTSMSLSGGEAQRIKLARALGKRRTGKGIYFLDEPTSGLERLDTRLLTDVLLDLANAGETVVMTEHDPWFIAETADYLIDLGSKPGKAGGSIASEGLPEDVFRDCVSSWSDLGWAFSL